MTSEQKKMQLLSVGTPKTLPWLCKKLERPGAELESGATSYYHPDHLSLRLLTDSNGNIIGQQGHYPFGDSWYAQNTSSKWQFTSYENDSESGNEYAQARYDVTRLGRFLSPDHMAGSTANPQSLNRYSYVTNDPIGLVDPSGLSPQRRPGRNFGLGNGGCQPGGGWDTGSMNGDCTGSDWSCQMDGFSTSC
jgi:RHS repeat-associated protein